MNPLRQIGAGVYEPPRPTDGAREGCTTCGSQQTETVDGINGRRCAEHPSVFDPATAVELARRGDMATALTYCRQEWTS